MTNNLYKPVQVGRSQLKNRVALAPLTRFRATDDHVPNDMMTEYYDLRAQTEGSLLITEATFISAQAGGYAKVPGIYSKDQIAAWKKITDVVHKRGSTIYVQLWALGRVASPAVLKKEGLEYVGASTAAPISANALTGEQEHPREMTTAEVQQYVKDYAQAARNAIEAGFDGVEIHGAHGYLPNQFLDNLCNTTRKDQYSGETIENRARFTLEIIDAVSEAIGSDRTAIRLSPWMNAGQANYDLSPLPEYSYVITEIQRRANAGKPLAYLHVVEPRVIGTADAKKIVGSNEVWIRLIYTGILIRAGGYFKQLAEEHAAADDKVLIAFGRHYISNPDLTPKIEAGVELTNYNRPTFYTNDSEGYTSYKRDSQYTSRL